MCDGFTSQLIEALYEQPKFIHGSPSKNRYQDAKTIRDGTIQGKSRQSSMNTERGKGDREGAHFQTIYFLQRYAHPAHVNWRFVHVNVGAL